MQTPAQIAVSYRHPAAATPREEQILARVDYLDARLKVALGDGDDAKAAEVRAELAALCAEWDAGRVVPAAE